MGEMIAALASRSSLVFDLVALQKGEEELLFEFERFFEINSADNGESVGFLTRIRAQNYPPPAETKGPILQLIRSIDDEIFSFLHFYQWSERRLSMVFDATFRSKSGNPELNFHPRFFWSQTHCDAGFVHPIQGSPRVTDANLWRLLRHLTITYHATFTDNC